MEALGVVLGALGVVLALAAIGLTVAVERLKRPRLEIEAADWPRQHPWQFVVVHVFNRPEMPRPFGFLTRNSAEGCEVTLEFRRHGQSVGAFPPLPGRWSSRPEPGAPVVLPSPARPTEAWSGSLSSEIVVLGPQAVVGQVFDPALAAESRSWDVAAGIRGEEIAVAVLTEKHGAYAWGAESQRFPHWDNPAWKLDQPGEYDVTVRLVASGVAAERTFFLGLGPPHSRRIELSEVEPSRESSGRASSHRS